MSKRRLLPAALLLLSLGLAGLGLARATAPDRPRTQQQQVDAIAATIRCPTCQGLSIKDSTSVLAVGARQIVADQVRQGRTPAQIRSYFAARYGDYILLSPRARGAGLLVWLLPGLLLPLAAGYGYRRLRRAPQGTPAASTPDPPEAPAVTDADAAAALSAYQRGELQPDASPAGEVLLDALQVRLAAATDGLGDAELARADARLGAAFRRYEHRARSRAAARASRPLPRRLVSALAAVALLAGAAAALSVGVRGRGATDLPTGDLPGTVPSQPGLAQLAAATTQRPTDPKAWVALGRAFQAVGTFTQALAAYDRALALDPSSDEVQFLRADVLVQGGSAKEALPVLVGLAARRPEDPETVLLLGLAQSKAGMPEAQATLRRFLALAPTSPAVPMVRGLLARR